MYTPKENGFFKDAPGHDRFNMPKDIVRVTGGLGGDSYLVLGSEKTLMYDCGMACFYKELLSNVHEVLDPLNRTIDFIVLSHTHYDHIGALPYVLDEYPNAVVMGSDFCEKVFNSETARNTMERLGESARILYGVNDVAITAKGLRLDKGLHDFDEIVLGDKVVIAYETPGHTNCSMCYGIRYKEKDICSVHNKIEDASEHSEHIEYIGMQNVSYKDICSHVNVTARDKKELHIASHEDVLFVCESVGTYDGNHVIEPSALKSYTQTKESALKLKALHYPILIGLHYGVIEKEFVPDLFDAYIKYAIDEEAFFMQELESGKTDEEIFEDHKALWWTDERELNQPFGAYSTNTHITIARLRKKLSGDI